MMTLPDPLEPLPIAPLDELVGLAPVLVVAPHPDDETLGAGGLIALLRERDLPVEVALVSDGAASHPNSKTFPPERLARVRKLELESALRALGVDPTGHLHRLDYPDGAVPGRGADRHDEAVSRMRALIGSLRPQAVLVPWRRDPHADHRATFEMAAAAIASSAIRMLEYPIWLRVRGAPDDWPRDRELRGFRVDIRRVLERKRRAAMAHVSQTTSLIDDADETFCLTADVLERLLRPEEAFLEPA